MNCGQNLNTGRMPTHMPDTGAAGEAGAAGLGAGAGGDTTAAGAWA